MKILFLLACLIIPCLSFAQIDSVKVDSAEYYKTLYYKELYEGAKKENERKAKFQKLDTIPVEKLEKHMSIGSSHTLDYVSFLSTAKQQQTDGINPFALIPKVQMLFGNRDSQIGFSISEEVKAVIVLGHLFHVQIESGYSLLFKEGVSYLKLGGNIPLDRKHSMLFTIKGGVGLGYKKLNTPEIEVSSIRIIPIEIGFRYNFAKK